MHVILTGNECKIEDDYALLGYLLQFRVKRHDQGTNKITYHGTGKAPKLGLDHYTAKLIENAKEIQVLEGFNQINNEKGIWIRIIEKEATT